MISSFQENISSKIKIDFCDVQKILFFLYSLSKLLLDVRAADFVRAGNLIFFRGATDH
jgi:hypothetical protein